VEEHRSGGVMVGVRRSCRRIYLGSRPMAHHNHRRTAHICSKKQRLQLRELQCLSARTVLPGSRTRTMRRSPSLGVGGGPGGDCQYVCVPFIVFYVFVGRIFAKGTFPHTTDHIYHTLPHTIEIAFVPLGTLCLNRHC